MIESAVKEEIRSIMEYSDIVFCNELEALSFAKTFEIQYSSLEDIAINMV